jgi:hypothetical protein
MSTPQQGDSSGPQEPDITAIVEILDQIEPRQSRMSDARRQTPNRDTQSRDRRHQQPLGVQRFGRCHTMVPCLRTNFPCSRLLVHPGVLTVHGSEWLTTGDGTPEGPASRPQAARRSLPSSTCLESPLPAEPGVHSIPPSPTTSSSPPGASLLTVPERVRPPHPTHGHR